MKRILLLLLLVGVVTYGSLPVWQRAIYSPHYVRVIGSDEELILAGLEKKKTFPQTFKWYGEKWCGGVDFYRPVTSQLFWLEKQVFGDKNLQYWLMVGIIFHTIAMVLGFFVVEKIFGSASLAFLTVILFAGHPLYLPFPRSSVSGLSWGSVGPLGGQHFAAVGMWKNAPEFWCAIPIFIGILAFLGGNLAIALICGVVAILTKETGFGFVPVLALVSWYNKKASPVWFWIVGIGLTIGLFSYRFNVLGSFGYRLGSNNSWLHRAIVYYGGTIGDQIANRMFPTVVFSIMLGVAIVCFMYAAKQKLRTYDLTGLALVIAGLVLATSISATSWWIGPQVSVLTGIMMLLSVNNAWLVVSIALITCSGISAIKYYPRECVLIIGWSLIFSAGLFTAAQVQSHAFYLANFFRVALYWLGLCGICNFFKPNSRFALLESKGDFFCGKIN